MASKELGAGNGSSYPGDLDTDAVVEVNSEFYNRTLARAEVPNDLAAAVVAVETELGVDPAGTLTDVVTFLQTEHETDGTHSNITATDITLLTTVSGYVGFFESTATNGEAIVAIKNDAREWRFGVIGGSSDSLIIRDQTATANRFAIDSSGNVGINDITPSYKLAVNGTLGTTGAVTFDQSSSSGAVTVLKLDQADIDDTFIDFIGTSAADGTRSISSDTTEESAKFGAVRVEINGVSKWIRIYDDES